jgi:hypothetical protein
MTLIHWEVNVTPPSSLTPDTARGLCSALDHQKPEIRITSPDKHLSLGHLNLSELCKMFAVLMAPFIVITDVYVSKHSSFKYRALSQSFFRRQFLCLHIPNLNIPSRRQLPVSMVVPGPFLGGSFI